jgi:hypothetical protein
MELTYEEKYQAALLAFLSSVVAGGRSKEDAMDYVAQIVAESERLMLLNKLRTVN